jgi:prepilin-type N-terminal cleavage/methylation domain-containing protein
MKNKSLKSGQQNGFTLVELLIAISIFVGFLTVVANSYISIIRAQKTANETRQMYSEMRNFGDFVNGEMRDGTIDYFCYTSGLNPGLDALAADLVRCPEVATHQIGDGDNLRIISKDGLQATTLIFDKANSRVLVYKFKKENDAWIPDIGFVDNTISDRATVVNGTAQVFAFSNLLVKDLHFEIYPKKNPAQIDKGGNLGNQFQPMVMLTADVASKVNSVIFNLHFQTMITSRAQ